MKRPVTILTADFDPRQLSVGLYAARSDSPAHNILRATGLTQYAEIVDERDLRGGVKTTVVRVNRAVGRGPFVRRNAGHEDVDEEMPFDPRHFQVVKKEYGDWKEMFWRELVQNSVDAGATQIALNAKKNDDGTWTCACTDNGSGMSLEVLRTKFLTFGGTTKHAASGMSGGFGKAKELIFLPWISWSVHTRNHVARGAANRFRVTQGAPLDGTRVEVVMAADDYTYDVPAKSFLAKCDLRGVHATVNGEKAVCSFRTKEKVFDIGDPSAPKAEVWFNKSGKFNTYQYLVRTKGERGSIYMFSGWVSDDVGGNVIVEIVRPSTEILTAHRSGFADRDVAREFEEFVGKITADVRSALRSKAGIISTKFRGSGMFIPRTAESVVLAQIGPLRSVGKTFEVDDESVGRAADVIETYNRSMERRADDTSPEAAAGRIGSVGAGTARAVLSAVPMAGQNHLEAAIGQLVWTPDFLLVNRIEGFKVPKKFRPDHMTPRVLHLAKVWTELCRMVLIQLGSSAKFGVGFLFSEDAAASCLEDDGSWLVLNPFVDVDKRDEIWRPNDDKHLKWLYAAAIHEATHMADGISTHNEVFAAALTHNMAKCAGGWARVKRIVATVRLRDATSPELDAGSKASAPRLKSFDAALRAERKEYGSGDPRFLVFGGRRGKEVIDSRSMHLIDDDLRRQWAQRAMDFLGGGSDESAARVTVARNAVEGEAGAYRIFGDGPFVDIAEWRGGAAKTRVKASRK